MKREDNAILGEQAPNLVSQLRAGADHTASYPVQRLQVLLLDGFTRHEAHVRTANGFADRLCVVRIILLRLQIRLDAGEPSIARRAQRLAAHAPSNAHPA